MVEKHLSLRKVHKDTQPASGGCVEMQWNFSDTASRRTRRKKPARCQWYGRDMKNFTGKTEASAVVGISLRVSVHLGSALECGSLRSFGCGSKGDSLANKYWHVRELCAIRMDIMLPFGQKSRHAFAIYVGLKFD